MVIKKIVSKLKKSKGFLTRKGALVNYEEIHALGLGFMDGFGFKGQGYRLEHWLKTHDDVNQKTMHYYQLGYTGFRVLKYILFLALLMYLGYDRSKIVSLLIL